MGKPSIRVLMTTDAVGGVWQYSTDLAAGLLDHGIETALAVLGPAPSAAQLEAASGIPGLKLLNTGLPLDWLSDAAGARAAARSLAAIAGTERFDLIHLNSPALAAEQAFPAPVLAMTHGCIATWWESVRAGLPLDPAFAWHADAMGRGLRACDRVIAPSASYARIVQRRYGLAIQPRVVYNGRAAFVDRIHVAQQDCAFTAGRLWDDAKNVRTLDAAAALVPFPIHAAGPVTAPHGGTIEIEHLHPLGCLTSEEMARILAGSPVFATAASFEPFGLAVLEAAASGCALVLSDIATFRELWDGAALFAAPDDHMSFARAIEDAVQDLPLREALGSAARARAHNFTIERMAAGTAAHYHELLQSRRAA
jgi:glycosyltransferase involved in cell wall biosynthesis